MKAKLSILFAAAAMALGSCSSNDEPQINEPTPEPTSEVQFAYNIIKPTTTPNFFINDAERAANEAVNDFGYRFFAATASLTDIKNMSVSPLSASMALSVVANSAEDDLTAAINKLLGVDNLEDLNSLNTKIISYLSKERDRECIELANSVWYADWLDITDQYEKDINEKYFAEVYDIDFTADDTPDIVDGWVSLKTHEVIPTISDAIDFNSISVALFINTLYFTGKWDSQFKTEANTLETFYGLSGNSIVDMMHNKSLCVYAKNDEGEYLEKDFCDGTMMSIFVPEAGADFQTVCQNFSTDKMKQIKAGAIRSRVTLAMPKFKNEMKLDCLGEILKKMGLDNFAGRLSKMGINLGCTLESAIQKTSIDVDEEGLTLAAVTAMNMVGFAGGTEPEYKDVTMTVDRPFIYTVTNRATGSILLMGTVTDL